MRPRLSIGLCLAALGLGYAIGAVTVAVQPQATSQVLGSATSLADAIANTYERPNEAGKFKQVALKKPKCGEPGSKCQAKKRKEAPQSFADGYRTLCVRLCDGFYFPISSSAQPAAFAADEARCQQTCSSPAKLFVYRNRDGSPETMVDLAGKPYTDLTTAFKHRVAYDASCTCKAQPWSEEARNQHRVYDLETQVAAGETDASAELAIIKAIVREQKADARSRSGAETFSSARPHLRDRGAKAIKGFKEHRQRVARAAQQAKLADSRITVVRALRSGSSFANSRKITMVRMADARR